VNTWCCSHSNHVWTRQNNQHPGKRFRRISHLSVSALLCHMAVFRSEILKCHIRCLMTRLFGHKRRSHLLFNNPARIIYCTSIKWRALFDWCCVYTYIVWIIVIVLRLYWYFVYVNCLVSSFLVLWSSMVRPTCVIITVPLSVQNTTKRYLVARSEHRFRVGYYRLL